MRKLITLAVGVSLALAVGCITTSLTPEGAKVRVTSNPEAVKGCTSLGEVTGNDHMNGGVASGMAEEQAHRRLMNAAAEKGGNVVLVTSSSTGHNGSSQRGEAYRCTEKAP
ncbi:MAG: hypothetical protein QOE68_3148 [Thermoanaerobaculia bacterium]|jgi:hypothetical protein|nr:hypothetical protein [Thermoanaerobaculia bacterium]